MQLCLDARGTDDPDSGLKRGEVEASERFLSKRWNWCKTSVHNFLEILIANGMLKRNDRESDHFCDRFTICNYDTYNPSVTEFVTEKVTKTNKALSKSKETIVSGNGDLAASKKLLEIFQTKNNRLPQVKALTAGRLAKCRTRINRAEHDGRLEQYLKDFESAVQIAQLTPFLRGENERKWRASFDWFVENDENVLRVLEGRYGNPETSKQTEQCWIEFTKDSNGKDIAVKHIGAKP
jgi:hypothetical protein